MARVDMERIENPQTILEIWHRLCEGRCRFRRQIPEGPAEAMPPHLLAQVQVESLEGLFHRLMGGEAGPFVMPGLGAHPSLVEIGLGLMQPVGRTVHAAIVGGRTAQPAPARQGCGMMRVPFHTPCIASPQSP